MSVDLCVCVNEKVFELRYCTAIVTELKMRFSLRLNFVLLTALLEDDGCGITMTSPSMFIHMSLESASSPSPTSTLKLSFGCLFWRIASKPQVNFDLSISPSFKFLSL